MEKKEIKEKKLTDEDIVMALCKQKQFLLEEQERTGNTPDTQLVYVTGEAVFEILDLIKRLQEENADYERKLEDGELVSKEWHDEQVLMLLRERDNLADYVKILKKEVDELKAENGKLVTIGNGFALERNNLREELKSVQSACKSKNAEIERLTEENGYLKQCADNFLADYQKAQKQVDELKSLNEKLLCDNCAYKDHLEKMDILMKEVNERIDNVVKDTANKIFRQVLVLYQGLSKAERETMTFEWKLLDLAVEYGVEVE